MKTTWIFSLILLSACITQRKAEQWMDSHETKAAKYCADKFSVDTVSKTEFKYVDSSGYKNAYNEISGYADSLFYQLDSIRHASLGRPCNINLDSLRKVIDKEIRSRLKPCVDSVVRVTNTVVNRAKETYLQGLIDEKDGVITKSQKDNQQLFQQVKDEKKWLWRFIGLVAIIAVYVFLKIRFKLPF